MSHLYQSSSIHVSVKSKYCKIQVFLKMDDRVLYVPFFLDTFMLLTSLNTHKKGLPFYFMLHNFIATVLHTQVCKWDILFLLEYYYILGTPRAMITVWDTSRYYYFPSKRVDWHTFQSQSIGFSLNLIKVE